MLRLATLQINRIFANFAGLGLEAVESASYVLINMKFKHFKRLFIALSISLSFGLTSLAQSDRKVVERAEYLLGQGMYEAAMELFESQAKDPLCQDYALLCAVYLRSPQCAQRVAAMDAAHPKTILNSTVHFQYALMLFEQGDYAGAQAQFDLVDEKSLDKSQLGEYTYKRGFSVYSNGDLVKAREYFLQCVALESPYLNPARFSLGCICYRENLFAEAESWFELARVDGRFSVLSDFYLVDCRFMRGDYAYVMREGEKIFDSLSKEGKQRMSRILSESYMVSGNARKAEEYFAREDMSNADNSDYFHAGSIYYALGEYASAVKYFESMDEKRDSLGQIASYQLGFSYVKLKNKVRAMACFKDASALRFDTDITEDAFFNYAKLAFDLDGNDAPFSEYVSRWSTSRKGDMIYAYLALAALKKGDYGAAVDAYDKVDELDDAQKLNYVKACYLRAAQLTESGSHSDALRFLKAASVYHLPQGDPLNQLCRFNLAEAYFRTGDYENARQTYTRLYNLSAMDGKMEGKLIPYGIAYTYFKERDWDSAAKWFDIYIRNADPVALQDAYLRRADCDFARKDYKASSASYRLYVSKYPSKTDIYPYYQLGVSYGLSGERHRKVEALSMVQDAVPGSAYYNDALYELGRAYNDVGDSLHAIRSFEMLDKVTSDPSFHAKALMGKGMVYRNHSNYSKALACYKQVVKEMPRTEYSSASLLSIQSIYTAMKQPDKYIEYLEKNNLSADIGEDERRELYYNTAEQLFLNGNWNGAVNGFARYVKTYPKDSAVPVACYYMAESYKALGQKEKACEYFSRSIEAGVAGSYLENALLGYASLSYSLEHYEDAYDAYLRLSKMDKLLSSKLDVYTCMMRSAYAAKRYEDAISASKIVNTNASNEALKREALFVQAKALQSTSSRDEALTIFSRLAEAPATAEGAESKYIIIRDKYDSGDFAAVEELVYDFAPNAGEQSYWLAKAFILLGDSFVERGNIEQAVVTYTSVRDGYTPPEGGDDVLPEVEEKLSAL